MASDTDPTPSDCPNLTYFSVPTLNFIENILHFAYPLWSPTLYRKLWRQIQQVDVVHLHEFIYVGNIMAFLIAKKLKKPVIITQHIGFIPYDSTVLRSILQLVNKTLGKWILKNSDRVVFCSKVIQDYWLALNFRFQKIPLFIPNGVDTRTFMPADPVKRQNIRRGLGYSNNRLFILFVGRFVEKKGLHIIHALASQYSTIDWGFAGWGPINPETWGLTNVRVFRDRQGSQLTPLYQAADLLILPSLGEAFPLVIQEAMACGTPTLISRESADQYPDISHLLFSEEVKVRDAIVRWSIQIERLSKDPQTLENIRSEVANFARRYWSWERCAEQYYQIYRDLVT
jgi:glycosyltransferase involved in cell wall biosynthesis